MMYLPRVMGALSRLLSYPDSHSLQNAELLYVILQNDLPEAAQHAAAFGAFGELHELSDLEEVYTSTFDINPACALEVGWHLFGEEYARGMFLVRMREELRKYGLTESNELPDHLTHVLAIVASMPDEEASRFVRPCVQPAVEKMKQALTGKKTPYLDVVTCLSLVLSHTWGDPELGKESNDQGQATNYASGLRGDLLRDYPSPNSMDCSGSCGAPLELVSIQLELPRDRMSPEHVLGQPQSSSTEPL